MKEEAPEPVGTKPAGGPAPTSSIRAGIGRVLAGTLMRGMHVGDVRAARGMRSLASRSSRAIRLIIPGKVLGVDEQREAAVEVGFLDD